MKIIHSSNFEDDKEKGTTEIEESTEKETSTGGDILNQVKSKVSELQDSMKGCQDGLRDLRELIMKGEKEKGLFEHRGAYDTSWRCFNDISACLAFLEDFYKGLEKKK